MSDLATAIGKNRTAVIVLVGGAVVIAFVLTNRVADIGEDVTEGVASLTRRIASSGFIAAAILVLATMLGAPVLVAFAASGIFLATSALGGAIKGLAGGAGPQEIGPVVCEAHGGVQSLIEAGTTAVVRCKDGQTFRLG